MSLAATATPNTKGIRDGSMTPPSLDRALSVARAHARDVLAGQVASTAARAELLESLKVWTASRSRREQERRANIAACRVALYAFDLLLEEAEHPATDGEKEA